MNKIIQGDCLEKIKKIESNTIDAIVTDPPYELGFMGKSWDNTGIANNVEIWRECLRVLKPGGHLLSFSGTRTYHRMAAAIEDAGFEVRDMIEWVYGSGFPKSLNIGKVTDKFLKTGNASWNGTGDSSNGALGYSKLQHKQDYRPEDYSNRHQNKADITEQKAKQWEGWGTALKPAHEPICMARKPLAEKTVAENCLKYGTGGININESRVGTEGARFNGRNTDSDIYGKYGTTKTREIYNCGRFPANLIHDNSKEVRECFPDTKSGWTDRDKQKSNSMFLGEMDYTGTHYTDNLGNASRFFKSIIYQAKASKSERNRGCEGLEEKTKSHITSQNFENALTGSGNIRNIKHQNNHPTVKPIALMEYLIKLITREGQTVFDPFAGSGTTGIACKNLNRNYILIEKEPEYIEIIKKRLQQK